MQCPVCKSDMVEFRKRTPVKDTNNAEKQAYIRAHYKCLKDDVWARVEFPEGTQQTAEVAR